MDTNEGMIPVTISIGVVILEITKETNSESLIKAADSALYQAKDNGRNCFKLSVSSL